jgi:hypothetical protein
MTMSLIQTRKTRIALSLAAVAGLSVASFGASAQAYTPQQFVSACESSVGNTVYLSESLKLQGSFTGETHVSATGCTVLLAPDAAFELDQITLNFGGPLVVRGDRNGRVQIEKAVIVAPSIALNLTGNDSQFQMKEGRMIANAGDLSMRFGQFGKLDMLDSGGWTRGGLTSAGALRIESGAFFQGALSNAGMEGAAGIFIAMNGTDTSWKIEKSTLNVSNFTFADASAFRSGPLSITGSAPKANLEILETNIRFASQAITMRLNGIESTLLLKQVSSQTGSQAVYFGAPSDKGVVLVENSLFYGNPGIVVETRSNGSTGVVGNPGSLNAQSRIRVSTGIGGSCVVTPLSSLTAPQVSACR